MSNIRTKKAAVFFFLLVAALVVGVLLYINSKTAPRHSFEMDGKKKLAVTGEAASVSNSSVIFCMKDLLIEAQEENMRVKNTKGNVAWSQKLPGKIVRMAGAGENLIVQDSLNNIHYFSLQGKLLWTYKAGYEIIDIFTEDNGSFLAEYKGITGSLAEVFTQNGSKISGISVENAYILSFSAGSGSFSVSILDTSEDRIKTKIITYNFNGDILWAQNFDNKIITQTNYVNNDKILVLGENTVYTYNNEGILQREDVIEGHISSFEMNDNILVIVSYKNNKYYVTCYDINMKQLSSMEIDANPSGINTHKKNYILYYNDELLVITSKGELIARYRSNRDISSAYMTDDNKVYMVSNRKLHVLEYVK